MHYEALSWEEKKKEYEKVLAEFERLKSRNLKLNMARGRPCKEQLDMVSDILSIVVKPEDCLDGEVDVRNYGEVSGIPSAKKLFAELLGVKPEQTFIGGNASLELMYGTIAKAYTNGLLHSTQPWGKLDQVKFLCPVPGYDRHFKISESFGMDMISIPMTEDGPDMDLVEKYIQDPAVKGIWCVPKYSNPEGIIYSQETVRRMAGMKPAAPDFLLMWDNAYCIHEFEGDFVPFPDILSLCEKAGNPDMAFEFASTSKVTYPGAGVAVMASSIANIQYMTRLLSIEIISYDKVNQLRHVRYLKDKEHILALMKKHAVIMKPKFDMVLRILDEEIAPLGIAGWKRPKGGYFISVDTKPGLAKRTLALCREAGVVMTTAGATFPYGKDPRDSNIRIAPSFPPVEELQEAMRVFCVCLKRAALEQIMFKAGDGLVVGI